MNKTLYRSYLKNAVFFIIAIVVIVALGLEYPIYGKEKLNGCDFNRWEYMYSITNSNRVVIAALTCAVSGYIIFTFYKNRTDKEINFINSLPITKKTQMYTQWLVMVTIYSIGIAAILAFGIFQMYIEKINISEYVLSVIINALYGLTCCSVVMFFESMTSRTIIFKICVLLSAISVISVFRNNEIGIMIMSMCERSGESIPTFLSNIFAKTTSMYSMVNKSYRVVSQMLNINMRMSYTKYLIECVDVAVVMLILNYIIVRRIGINYSKNDLSDPKRIFAIKPSKLGIYLITILISVCTMINVASLFQQPIRTIQMSMNPSNTSEYSDDISIYDGTTEINLGYIINIEVYGIKYEYYEPYGQYTSNRYMGCCMIGITAGFIIATIMCIKYGREGDYNE